MRRIPFLRPNLVKKEHYLCYLSEIDESRIYSNYGPLNAKFEQRIISEWFANQGFCTTVNNATTGLILAISQLKRPMGKFALMPSFTFAATPLAAQWCGLTPYFIDVDPHDWCLSERALQSAIDLLGDEVAVVLPYATFGSAMPLEYYRTLHNSGTPVVIDAAASFGTTENGVQFGQDFPGAVVFSFHATKSFGIGEGGLIYSGSESTIQQIRRNGNFGFNQQRESEDLGLNSKISEYTAAIGLATLDIYSQKITLRQQVHEWYLDLLKNKGLLEKNWNTQNYSGSIAYQFMPMILPDHLNNKVIMNRLQSVGIEARGYFSPTCHQQLQFSNCPNSSLVITEQLSSRILSLPLWEEMSVLHIEYIVDALSDLHKEFS